MPQQQAPVLIIDNGAGLIKAGFSDAPSPAHVFENCQCRSKGERALFIGDALPTMNNILSIVVRRGFDRGYLVNMEVQMAVWNRLFSLLGIDAQTAPKTPVLITEPLLNFEQLRDGLYRVLFNTYKFKHVLVVSAAELAALKGISRLPASHLSKQAACGVVVDVGFSRCTVAPVVGGAVVSNAIKRVSVGGKLLTNYLKEIVTYRSLNMTDESVLMNLIKHQVCFVSQDPKQDMIAAKTKRNSPYYVHYVLPDGVSNLRGYVRDIAALVKEAKLKGGPVLEKSAGEQQVLPINSERFTVPELLFSPGMIGIDECGVPEAISIAVQACHPSLHPLLFGNVMVVGGCAKIQGFRERLESELRPLVPDTMELMVSCAEDCDLDAWGGGVEFVRAGLFAERAWSRAEYQNRVAGAGQVQLSRGSESD